MIGDDTQRHVHVQRKPLAIHRQEDGPVTYRQRRPSHPVIFVSHNLGLILETCDRITVMYSGEAVETGNIEDVFDRMRHPYTQGLFRSIPLPGADKNSRPLVAIPGQLPLPMT